MYSPLRTKICLLIFMIAALTVALAQVPTGSKQAGGSIVFSVRDVTTGYSVPASISTQSINAGEYGPVVLKTDEFGRLRFDLPAGHYLFEITASDYERSRTHFAVDSGKTLPVTINMSSNTPPETAEEASKLRPLYTLVDGYIVDAITGRPLPNVLVRFQDLRDEARTNERGYFAISVPAPKPTLIEGVEVPGTGSFTAELHAVWSV